MSIKRSMITTVVSSLDTITDVVKTTQEAVSIGTNYVHNRAISSRIIDKENVILDTAKTLQINKEELDSNENLQEIFNSLADNWE